MPEPMRQGLVGDDGVTIGCAVCGTAFVPSGRRRFCSAACRQAAWRHRHRQAATPAAQPSPTPRSASVYECPACGARYLGTQRCDDCNRFCRLVGPGAPCPHCDEPVAVVDLLLAIPTLRKEGTRTG